MQAVIMHRPSSSWLGLLRRASKTLVFLAGIKWHVHDCE